MGGWIFGIDGGGTGSRIRVESLPGSLLHQGQGGSTNIASNDPGVVSVELERLIAGAFETGLDPAACLAAYIGSAGVDRPDDRSMMANMLRASFFKAAGLTEGKADRQGTGPQCGAGNDAEPALTGALGDLEGFLLIAGTGSIAYGRTRAGKTARAGGWGHHLGDEGSAFWIAFEGIKRGIRASEGRDTASGLIDAAVSHFGLPDAPSLIPFTYRNFDKARIASFAPLVAMLSDSGDALARSILDSAAAELAALVVSVHDRLAPDIDHRRLALYGGLLDNNRALRSDVTTRLHTCLPALEIVEPAGNAQEGACRLARSLLDNPPPLPPDQR